MEIYKLSDEIPGGLTKKHKRDRMGIEALSSAGDFDGGKAGGGTNGGRGGFAGELRITDIKQAVRNENRVNVYVNGKYAFSLDIAQVVDLGVKVGRVLDAGELAEMKKASEFGKAYQRALEWVLVRPRSERELRDYLKRRERTAEAKERKMEWARDKEIAEAVAQGEDVTRLVKRAERMRVTVREKYDFTEIIVGRLCERGYVDDRRFAEYYVENRFVKKGVSEKRLRLELRQKGVADGIVDEVLSGAGRDERGEILKMIKKKRGKYDDDKLVQYLCRQGFDYGLVRELVENYEG